MTRQRFRYSSATTVAAIISAISGVSLGSYAPYLLPLLIIPLGVALWTWRAGTDADTNGLTVRHGLRNRRVPWSSVTGLVADARGRVDAQLDSGASVRLTAVTAADLPRLVAASGHELEPAPDRDVQPSPDHDVEPAADHDVEPASGHELEPAADHELERA